MRPCRWLIVPLIVCRPMEQQEIYRGNRIGRVNNNNKSAYNPSLQLGLELVLRMVMAMWLT